jgi:hypothetical protein
MDKDAEGEKTKNMGLTVNDWYQDFIASVPDSKWPKVGDMAPLTYWSGKNLALDMFSMYQNNSISSGFKGGRLFVWSIVAATRLVNTVTSLPGWGLKQNDMRFVFDKDCPYKITKGRILVAV